MKSLTAEERDTARLNVIKEETWLKYFKELWSNEEKIEENNSEDTYNHTVDPITMKELENALTSLKNRKAGGPDGISAELINYGGPIFKIKFLHFINQCWYKTKIPDEWLEAIIVPIFKKEDRNKCSNYRGISLLNVSYKVYTKIINCRIAKISGHILLEEQQGFRKGRSTIDDIFCLKQIMEKRIEFNRETHLAFIDLEKASDRISRQKLWGILRNRGYPEHLIQTVKSLYEGTKIMIKGNQMKEEINQGVRQGCSLSPILFNIYMDDMIREWKKMVPSGIYLGNHVYLNLLLYADDQVIIQENEDDLQRSIYKLNQLCKEYNFHISLQKTKIMAFKGSVPIRSKIVLDDQVLEQISHFNYLGCDVTYLDNHEITNRVHKFQVICGCVNKTLNKGIILKSRSISRNLQRMWKYRDTDNLMPSV